MFKLEIHKCDQNPVEVYVHKFKTEIKQRMMDDFCTKYATIEIWLFRFLKGVHIFIFFQIANLAVQIFIFFKTQI